MNKEVLREYTLTSARQVKSSLIWCSMAARAARALAAQTNPAAS
jgi:hypothetical protein